MDFLDNKYLPADDVKNIAYSTSPSQIFSFCAANKLTRTICRSKNFWPEYIGDNQLRYNDLILEIARIGDLNLFKQLWMYSDNIYSEPQVLYPAFEIAIINDKDPLAEYLLNLYLIWSNLKFQSDNVEKSKIITYTAWADSINKKWRTEDFLSSFESYKYLILLKLSLMNDDMKKAKEIITILDINSKVKPRMLANALSFTNSFKSYKLLAKTTIKKSMRGRVKDIFNNAVLNSNFNLATEINEPYLVGPNTSTYGSPVYRRTAEMALRSKSNESLRFIRDIMGSNAYQYYDLATEVDIRNKDVLYEIIKGESRRYQARILSLSFSIFKPQEYTNIVIKYLGCVNNEDKSYTLVNIINKGEWYKAILYKDQVPVCSSYDESGSEQDEDNSDENENYDFKTNKSEILDKLDKMIQNIEDMEDARY